MVGPVSGFTAGLFPHLDVGAAWLRVEEVTGGDPVPLVSAPRLCGGRIALDPPGGPNGAPACLLSVGREASLRSLRRKADAVREEIARSAQTEAPNTWCEQFARSKPKGT